MAGTPYSGRSVRRGALARAPRRGGRHKSRRRAVPGPRWLRPANVGRRRDPRSRVGRRSAHRAAPLLVRGCHDPRSGLLCAWQGGGPAGVERCDPRRRGCPHSPHRTTRIGVPHHRGGSSARPRSEQALASLFVLFRADFLSTAPASRGAGADQGSATAPPTSIKETAGKSPRPRTARPSCCCSAQRARSSRSERSRSARPPASSRSHSSSSTR